MKTFFSVGLTLMLLAVLIGCSEPPAPPEVQQALRLEQDLWRAGATVYCPESYADFIAALKTGRDQFSSEKSRMAWFRDYESVATNFRSILTQGEQVRKQIDQKKDQQTNELLQRTTRITERVHALRDLVQAVKDSRLNTGLLVTY